MRGRTIGGVALLAAGVSVATIAACGGGGSTGGETRIETLTRAEFVRKASDLCERSRHSSEHRLAGAQALVGAGAKPTPAEQEKVIRYMVVVPARTLSEDLERLGPVEGGDAELERYASALAQDAKEASAQPLTVTGGTAFIASDTLANEAGLSRCVR
jgi:hypothetical protein